MKLEQAIAALRLDPVLPPWLLIALASLCAVALAVALTEAVGARLVDGVALPLPEAACDALSTSCMVVRPSSAAPPSVASSAKPVALASSCGSSHTSRAAETFMEKLQFSDTAWP